MISVDICLYDSESAGAWPRNSHFALPDNCRCEGAKVSVIHVFNVCCGCL